MKKFLLSIIVILTVLTVKATDPMATKYTVTQCEGSLSPYPTNIHQTDIPDSLTAVYINHVGRHGARYPASAANCLKLKRALDHADSIGSITPLGRKLMTLNDEVIHRSNGQWGALDSLGMAEQRAIASRMFANYPGLFKHGAHINALSSYSPRSMMSMYAFTHQLDRLNNRLSFTTSTGRINSKLTRPFDVNNDYLDFRRDNVWQAPYDEYMESHCPTSAITRVLGLDYPFGSAQGARDLALTEYYVIAGLSAMSMASNSDQYFTTDEWNALWSCFNLRQYLQYTATTISSVPADIAANLVLNLIETTDATVQGSNTATADLRFGHAETLMPLLSLLRLPGCYYVTNYWDTVAGHWRDFDVVPMAANLQIILFKAKKSGRYYVRFDINERPTPLPGSDSRLYIPWEQARQYMMRCVPLYAQ